MKDSTTNPVEIPLSRLLTTTQVSELTGLTPGHLANERSAGRGIPYIKLGSAVRYSARAVAQYIEAHTVMPVGA